MVDIYAYITRLPNGMREMVAPCLDGYTIYVDDRLSDDQRIDAYQHALGHILNGDFSKQNVQQIESSAHQKGA